MVNIKVIALLFFALFSLTSCHGQGNLGCKNCALTDGSEKCACGINGCKCDKSNCTCKTGECKCNKSGCACGTDGCKCDKSDCACKTGECKCGCNKLQK